MSVLCEYECECARLIMNDEFIQCSSRFCYRVSFCCYVLAFVFCIHYTDTMKFYCLYILYMLSLLCRCAMNNINIITVLYNCAGRLPAVLLLLFFFLLSCFVFCVRYIVQRCFSSGFLHSYYFTVSFYSFSFPFLFIYFLQTKKVHILSEHILFGLRLNIATSISFALKTLLALI